MVDFAPAAPARPTVGRLPYPRGVDVRRPVWSYAATVGVYHLLAMLALLPWFFSWTGVGLAVAGTYVFGGLGINLGYHRLLTHRGFACPRWLEYGLVLLGVCSMQDTPARWVAVHRRHHEHADRQEDPHSPLAGFLWGHVGWMLVANPDLTRLGIYDRYAKDILRDRLYRRLERTLLYPAIIVGSWAAFLAAGFAAAMLAGEDVPAAARFGLSLLVWGVFARTVIVWHITWAVNSVAHVWGYRSYATGEESRNNWVVSILTSGEGWHNNHHAAPRAARHGHRWWEIDLIFGFVWLLEAVGLAWDVTRPDRARIAAQAETNRARLADGPGEAG